MLKVNLKSFTLIELLLSIVLLTMVLFTATSLDVASLSFFKSSKRKSEILNEVSYITENVQKSVFQAHGWKGNRGYFIQPGEHSALEVRIDNVSSPTPDDFSDDSYAGYIYDNNTHTLSFCDGEISCASPPAVCACTGTSQVLSDRILSCVFSRPANSSVIHMDIRGVYNTTGPADDERKNPHTHIKTDFFMGAHSFR